MSAASINLLGDVSITRADGTRVVLGRQQPRTVVALLVDRRHRVVGRSEIADVLWEQELPDHWAGAVRGVVSKIRAFFEEAGANDWLVTTGEGWRLELPDGAVVDVDRCRASVDQAEQSLCAGGVDDPGSADHWATLTDELIDAERFLGAELAPGARGSWVDDRREDTGRWHRRALAALVCCARRANRPEIATDSARALVRLDPYSDQAARAEMQSLADAGDRPGALDAFDAFGRRLHDDLGVGPEVETERLARSIRGLAPAAPAVPGTWGGETSSIVGRAPQIDLLRREWQEVVGGSGAKAVLISGEPGAGKTRLATEAARLVDRGLVLWGRCSPDRRVSFEPIVEALARVLHRDRSPLDALGPLAIELAPLLPEFVDGPALEAPSDRSGSTDRSQLFRAVTAAFRSIIGTASVWVVDDVQWANEDTTALLSHLVVALADLDLLVVFTSRSHDPGVADMLTTTARSIPLDTVTLVGLDLPGVVDLLSTAGVVDAEQVGQLVLDRTGGNPFYIRELVRSVGADGRLDPLALPATLRSWIDQRVAGLGEQQAEALNAASVLGNVVDLEVLAQMVGTDAMEALDRCRPLVADGLMAERDGVDGGDLAFAHAFTREAVHDGLGSTRSRLLHRRAAEAVRSVHPDSAWSEVAHHLSQAGSAVDGEAVPAMFAAGDEALAQLAWVSARDWFEEAAGRRPDASAQRVRALIGLGTSLRSLGDRDGGRAALSEALATADVLGEHRLRAEATLGLVGGGARGVSESMGDLERAELLRAAIDGLGPHDDDLVIPVQLELALALLLTDHDDERVRLAEDALARARRLGRDDLLAKALLGSRVAHHGPEQAEVRLVEVDEVLTMTPTSRSHDINVGALMARHEDALLIGDRALAREALAEADHEVEQSGHPYWRWVVQTWKGLGLIIDGDLDAAEALAFAAVQLQADHPESMGCLGVNLVNIRLFQRRSGEVVDLLAEAADQNPQIPCYRAVLALCLAEADRSQEAEFQYRTFADVSFRTVPDDTNMLLTLGVLADVATTVEDGVGAAQLLDLLSPHADRQVLLNCFAGGGAYWGPVANQLGCLSSLLGDDAAAEDWWTLARESAARFCAPLALARIPPHPR